MTYRTLAIALSMGLVLTSFLTTADAEGITPNAAREAKLRQLKNASVESVFAQLKADDFIYDHEFFDEGINRAFMDKKDEAVRLALRQIQSSRNSRDTVKAKDFFVAKKILQKFPDKSQKHLMEIYRTGAPEIRKNAICILAGLPMNDSVRELLMQALDDKSFCDEDPPGSTGEPLRVCDALYNEIVWQYEIPNVLRTIGAVHKIEVRDYHIGKLKSWL